MCLMAFDLRFLGCAKEWQGGVGLRQKGAKKGLGGATLAIPHAGITAWDTARVARMTFGRITIDPAVMGGLPCIRNLRIPVGTIVAMAGDGMTVEEIVTDLPDLTAEDVTEALRYATEAGAREPE